jgi:tripartite ATP-independent transporter DctM subunit
MKSDTATNPYLPTHNIPVPKRTTGTGILSIILAAAAIGVVLVILFGHLDRAIIGVLAIVLLLLLMGLTIPIGISMIVASTVGLIAITGYAGAELSVKAIMFEGIAQWGLVVIPLFVIMGVAMGRAGVTTSAYRAAGLWTNRIPGGLSIATVLSGGVLATTSGSTIAMSYTLGRMALPEMFRAGYKPSLATSSVAMAGTLGQVFPPSILMVIYASIAEVPVGQQLIAGIVPGLLLLAAFVIVVFVWASVYKRDAPRLARSEVTWSARWRSLKGLIPVVIIILVVTGGLFTGLFTATEAAAFGAITAIIVGWVALGRGRRGFRSGISFVGSTFFDSVKSIASLFVVIIGALLITRMMGVSGLTQGLGQWLIGLNLEPFWFLILLIAVYIFLGMFLESLPMILLTVPLLALPLQEAGIDLIWFGVFLIIMCEIGMVFPPVGLLTFIVHRVAQGPAKQFGLKVPLVAVFKGIMPFVAAAIVVTIVLILWPEIVLWLPGLSAAK